MGGMMQADFEKTNTSAKEYLAKYDAVAVSASVKVGNPGHKVACGDNGNTGTIGDHFVETNTPAIIWEPHMFAQYLHLAGQNPDSVYEDTPDLYFFEVGVTGYAASATLEWAKCYGTKD